VLVKRRLRNAVRRRRTGTQKDRDFLTQEHPAGRKRSRNQPNHRTDSAASCKNATEQLESAKAVRNPPPAAMPGKAETMQKPARGIYASNWQKSSAELEASSTPIASIAERIAKTNPQLHEKTTVAHANSAENAANVPPSANNTAAESTATHKPAWNRSEATYVRRFQADLRCRHVSSGKLNYGVACQPGKDERYGCRHVEPGRLTTVSVMSAGKGLT